MENVLFITVLLGLYGLYLLWLWKAHKKKLRKVSRLEIKKLEPPLEDIEFLSLYGYDAALAAEMWEAIRSSTGYEDFFTTRIFARRIYTTWYLKLSPREQKQYEWNNRNSNLQFAMERRSDYWEDQPRLLQFVRRVRSYTE